MYTYKNCNLHDLLAMREKYFLTLSEIQEIHLELMLSSAEYFKIFESTKEIGYCIFNSKQKEKQLIEFYIETEYMNRCEGIFHDLIKVFQLSKVLCKSYDPLLLKCCLHHSKSFQVIGIMFREYTHTDSIDITAYAIRLATNDDLEYLLSFQDELYESPEQLALFIKNKSIYMFTVNESLIGCGLLIKVLDNRSYYDIGVWVNSAFRKNGHAGSILYFLKVLCIKNNLIPVAGCAVDNPASRKALERIGFRSRYDLIEFRV